MRGGGVEQGAWVGQAIGLISGPNVACLVATPVSSASHRGLWWTPEFRRLFSHPGTMPILTHQLIVHAAKDKR